MAAFQAQCPKINLTMKVDLSKYNDARVHLNFAEQQTPPDVIHLQTLQPSTQAITSTFSVRDDIAAPAGFQPIVNYTNASLAEFPAFMEDRATAERFRAIMQLYVGDPTGPDPGTTYKSPSMT